MYSCKLLTVPSCVRRMTSLTDITIVKNELVGIPDWVGELVSLKSLTINANQLSELPSSLRKLENLRALWLGGGFGGNGFRDLPAWIADMERLESLNLDANPLNPELAAAYKQGLDAVKAYLRAKAEAQIVLNEAKLILIGEGEVGKSCLLGALRGDEWVEGRDTTHGIEIKPVVVNDPAKGTKITLDGWDFGGHRVYRPTHQLFFSAPAIYLVVWKPREGSQAGAVREWMKLVKYREPDAKIIVVATHGGPKERQPDIDKQEIWDLFGKETVIDFFHVDCQPPKNAARRGHWPIRQARCQRQRTNDQDRGRVHAPDTNFAG